MKKVTIIIPAKNVSMYIEDCLKSCSDHNNISNIKIIIINDASDDETGVIIEN
ncbi:glycosyltransferase [Bacillus subtilis]|uniref:glycosyltransferase n=1 Tax=Pseudochrobactrum asaccharolyticum TaxID=354351 RepID=UPI003C6E279D|nr:glycosyltransferase [Pseudochrobactrum asaccharolyticum]MCF7673621.1 glycosyltransferase [Bacillus subtilis]